MLVMQDVLVDGAAKARASGTTGSTADDAVDDDARGCSKYSPNGAG